MKATEGMVLKADKRGRVRRPVFLREEILNKFEQSGVSGMKFAELTGIKYQTLATWIKKRRGQGRGVAGAAAVAAPGAVRWLEAEVASPAGRNDGPALTLQLPGDVRLVVADEKQALLAAVLVRALTQPC